MTSVFRSFRSLHSLRFLRSNYPHPYYQDPGRFFRPNEPALEECQRVGCSTDRAPTVRKSNNGVTFPVRRATEIAAILRV
jgi:hypothetical protein